MTDMAPPNSPQSHDAATTLPDAFDLARMFHEEYERLAPELGYRTREESAVPWDRVPATNKNLMVATARAVLERIDRG